MMAASEKVGPPLQESLVAGGQDVELGQGQISATQQEIISADVVMFMAPGCPFCTKAYNKLQEFNVPFKTVDISSHKQELLKLTGKSSAPSAWVKGKYIGGCNDGSKPWMGVVPMLENGTLQGLLNGLDPESNFEEKEEEEMKQPEAMIVHGTTVMSTAFVALSTLPGHWYISVINLGPVILLIKETFYSFPSPHEHFDEAAEAKAIEDNAVVSKYNQAIRMTIGGCHFWGAFGLLYRNRNEAMFWQILDSFRFLLTFLYGALIFKSGVDASCGRAVATKGGGDVAWNPDGKGWRKMPAEMIEPFEAKALSARNYDMGLAFIVAVLSRVAFYFLVANPA